MEIDKSELRRLYIDQKLTIKEISATYNVSVYCIYKLIKKYEIETRRKGPRGPYSKPPEESQLRELYVEQKKSLREVGKFYGVSYVTVYKWMQKYGIARRASSGRPKKIFSQKDELYQLFLVEKCKPKQIAEKFNVSEPTVRERLKEYGLL